MPIPNDRGPAIDAVLALDLGIESREAAEIVVDRVADILRYAPMGDNHHNAAACPHCRGELRGDVHRQAENLHLALVSREQARDWGDRLWEIAKKCGVGDEARDLKELSSRFHAMARR
jgi:hypothetical protein